MIVYEITCTTTGKSYIGITTKSPIRLRFNDHVGAAKAGSNRVLCKAIRKHGVSSFTISEVAVVLPGQPIETLFEMERFFIRERGTKRPGGYNMTDGGEGMAGLEVPASTRAKISAGNKGKSITAEQKEKIKIGRMESDGHNRGRKWSAETIEKRRLGLRKYYEAHAHPMLGKTCKPEHVAKRKAARKANPWVMPDHLREMSRERMTKAMKDNGSALRFSFAKRRALKEMTDLFGLTYVN